MINFKLEIEKFNYLGTECNIIPISFINYHNYKTLIEDCIYFFNDEIEWDGMFSLNQALVRISNGMVLYVCMGDTQPLGYVWFKDKEDKRLLFNLFFRNKNVIKKYTGKEFVSSVINTYEKNKIIVCEVDEWNEKSLKLFKKLGFQEL
jgi:hypothetical protein